jgi:hypothetical protein
MKYLHLIVLLLCSLTVVKSQNFSKEFGKIAKDEIELSRYAKDTSAEAVVLFDLGKSYFVRTDNSFNVVFERATRIKILSEAGLDWAEVEIPFYQEGGIYEKVYDIEAYTYNYENGILKKTALDPDNYHDEKINEYWNVRKLALPEIKEGSVIEYKYKISSQHIFNLRDWEFQWRIPVVYSEYVVKMVPFFEYTNLLQGANNFDSHIYYIDDGISRTFGSVDYKDMVHKYVMEDVPAFQSEEFITSMNDYIIKLDFQLSKIIQPDGATNEIITTWPKFIDKLKKLPDFGKYINKSERAGQKILDPNMLSGKFVDEKFNSIMDYVKGNYNWNGINEKYTSKPVGAFMKDRYGNSADINLFAIGLLNAADIEAFPVIISTRDHGKIRYNYPFSHFFNYVLILAKIDENYVLTDATEVLGSNYRIPPRCLNDKGLLIKDSEEVKWIDLHCNFPSELQTNISIEYLDSKLNAHLEVSATEYEALQYRKAYNENKKRLEELLTDKGYKIKDTSLIVKNQQNINEPFIMSYNIEHEAEVINNKIYISPFLEELLADNPLKQAERTYPIDMIYPSQKIYHSTIHIPEGYKVDHIPKDIFIKNKLFSLDYKVTSDDKEINISFTYYFKNSVYPAQDYNLMKFYFNQIVQKRNEKIVLSKL